jgi:predicted PhzF superfamily epimerase YddE/YHI9
MRLTVVDAFTDRPFSGNPAAVAVLEAFPTEQRMQDIAREMNLSETAFTVRAGDGRYDLRWFTPTVEIDFCGHATLATAHVLGGDAEFSTRAGILTCSAHAGRIEMDFPAATPTEAALGDSAAMFPTARWAGMAANCWFVELGRAADVIDFVPDQAGIAAMGGSALAITARAEPPAPDAADIISRVFGPNVGIAEDPVTGSVHCGLARYWSPRFGRDELLGYQASVRGGFVHMRDRGDRATISGQAVTVAEVTVLA